LNSRFEHGEFRVSDSIRFADSLRFITPGGRVVYGGGGIMPDVFVPVDTSGISPYFLSVRPLIYRFALKYTEDNRESLKKYSDAYSIEKYLDGQRIFEKFTEFASANGISKDRNGLLISGKRISIELKAYIARNILDNKGFYPIWEKNDSTLKFAIDYIKKNQ